MRILFIHEVNYRNKVIFEMHEFPELLALRGHDVTFFHYPEHPDTRRISLRTHREKISGRAYTDAAITLVTPPTFGGGSLERFVAPMLDYPALSREIRTGGYDVILSYSVPTTGWQAVAAARRQGVPIVFRALDVSHKIRRSAVSGLIRIAERYVYRNATVLSANNPAMAEYCIEESGRTGPTVVNLAPIDLGHFAASDSTDQRAAMGLNVDHKVVLYMGTFFSFSGLDTTLRGMRKHFAIHPELRLVLVGGGELEETLRATVRELALEDRVIFTGVIPYSALPGYLRSADVAINPFEPELLTHVAFPHKVLQYMAAGVPAVSTSLRGLRGVLGDSAGVGWVDQPSDVADAAVVLAYKPPAELAGIGALERAFIAANFSKESATTALEGTLLALC